MNTNLPPAPSHMQQVPEDALMSRLRALVTAHAAPPPADAVILPGNAGEIGTTAVNIFKTARNRGVLYRHGDTVVRPDQTLKKLVPETAQALRSTIEKLGTVYTTNVKSDGTVTHKRRPCSLDQAQALLACGDARGTLNSITHVSETRLLIQTADAPDGFRLLDRGFHEHGGGTFVWNSAPEVPDVPLEEAKAFIVDSLNYYKFATLADQSRAIAAILTPALKRGGFINGPVPMVFVHANRAGAGKTQKTLIISAYYGLSPLMVSHKAGGVGSMSEAISTAILEGQTDILIDNVRQLPDAEFIEALITGSSISGRAAFERCRGMETSRLNLMMTTNGISLTEDLASRANMIEICYRGDYDNETTDALATIKANQPYALGCIYSILKTWCREGRPTAKVSSCRFPSWAAAVNGIVTHIFGLPNIGLGAEQARNRTSSLEIAFLMELGASLFSEEAGYTGGPVRKLTTQQLVVIAQRSEIDLGKLVKDPDAELSKLTKHLGMSLVKDVRLKSAETIDCGIFTVRRTKESTNKDGPVYEFTLKPKTPELLAEGNPGN